MLAIDLAVNYADRINKVVLSGIGVPTVLDTPMSGDLRVDADGDFLARTWDVYTGKTSPGVSPDITVNSFIVGLEARRRPFDAHIAMLRWDRTPLLEHLQ